MSNKLEPTTLPLSTLSVEDFPAKTSALQEREQALKESEVDCGLSSLGSFAKWDHDTLSWKTSQLSLLGGSVSFSETWPNAGMMQSGTVYQRHRSAPRTLETGSLSWPTPLAGDGTKDGTRSLARVVQTGHPKGRLDGKLRNGRSWPTPTARDWRSGKSSDERFAQNSRPLSEHVEREVTNGGRLNPTWVEWLMGFPLGWTDLDASETQ